MSQQQENIEKRNKLCQIYLDLESKGIEIRGGNLMTERVTYCRGPDLQRLYNENKEDINKRIKEITGIDIGNGGNTINAFYNMYYDLIIECSIGGF
jgi:hypothetical protein